MTTQRKKQYEIHKASKRAKDIKGVIAGGKRMEFGKSGAFITDDPVIAREIEEKYGEGGQGDAVVIEVDDLDKSQPNRRGRSSRQVWTVGKMPWK
jgi:hypothetical protein